MTSVYTGAAQSRDRNLVPFFLLWVIERTFFLNKRWQVHVAMQNQIDFIFYEPTHESSSIVYNAGSYAQFGMFSMYYRHDVMVQHTQAKGFYLRTIAGPLHCCRGFRQLWHT